VCVGSYLLFASAGPAFPESFKHEDGGVYRGQWRVRVRVRVPERGALADPEQ